MDIAHKISQDPQASLALRIIDKLSQAGHTAYLAGGCVRDTLLGRIPKDYDVATNAVPQQIRILFGHRRTLPIGAAFGVISVLDDTIARQAPVEVATFRSDGDYSDGRRPDSVQFSTPELDAQRRDFTINGLFYNPQTKQVLDFVGGQDDLRMKNIRAIGSPADRFREDRLRLLRAVRFAATYEFSLDPKTLDAIREQASQVVVCSGERIGAEMQRMLRPEAVETSIRLLRQTGLAQAIMPDIDDALQNPSVETRFFEQVNSLRSFGGAVKKTSADRQHAWLISLTLLVLSTSDQAKQTLNLIVKHWHLSNEQRDSIRTALKLHRELLVADQLAWSRLQPMLVHRYRDVAVAVARAIAMTDNSRPNAAFARIDRDLRLPAEELNPPPLLTGDDLIREGMQPGPDFKSLLQSIRDAQLDGLLKTKTEAQEWIKR